LLVLIIRWRVRQLAGRERARLENLMLERERIARELHDTLLQSNQALILQVQTAVREMPEDSPARDELEQALDRADEVMDDGRERVAGLRSVGQTMDDLPLAIRALGKELAQGPAMFNSRVVGEERSLYANAGDEAWSIVREALLNAFRHADASSVEAVLIYGADALRIEVRDDGRGINLAELKGGARPGHWGMTGMRERAERLGARFQVTSMPGSGTTVAIEVPAHVAYLRRSAFGWRWRRPRSWKQPAAVHS
jgi:signal transduction histidine kinase